MSFHGKYARPIIACAPEVQGTAICHNDGKCFMCEFGLKHDTEVYLKEQAEAMGCKIEISVSQLSKMSTDMFSYGFPLCLCKAFCPEIMNPADVKCPCPEAQKDITDKGKCHCGIFRRVD